MEKKLFSIVVLPLSSGGNHIHSKYVEDNYNRMLKIGKKKLIQSCFYSGGVRLKVPKTIIIRSLARTTFILL